MTERERLLAAMTLREPDRVPINVWGVPVWDDEWVKSRHPSYGPVIEVTREYGSYRGSWSPPTGTFVSMTDEVGHRWEQIDHPDWVEHVTWIDTPAGPLRARSMTSKRGLPGLHAEHLVKTLEDVDRVLSVPYVPLTEVDVSGFRAEEERIGDRGLTMVGIGCNPVMHIVEGLLGSELFAFWTLEQRGVLLELLEVFLQRTLDRVDAMIAAGVGPVFSMLGEEYITPPLHGPRDFRDFCTVPDRKIAERVHEAGGILHIHSHGSVGAMLEDFAEFADVLHPLEAPPMGDVELADAKRRIGDRVCLEGNIQYGDLCTMPTPQLVELVKRTLDAGAPGGGFILAPTASPYTEVLTDQTVRNYVAMVETAVEYGGYR